MGEMGAGSLSFVGPTVSWVGPYRVVGPAWVPEAGTWHVGRGGDGSSVLIRLATADDRAAARAQRGVLRRIVDPRVPSVLAHDEGTGSFAISYAVGTPLNDAIAQRAAEGGGVVLTPATLVDTLLELGRALLAAHAAGVVHGSLDPDRIVLGPEGRVWLFGFGSGVEPGTPWLPPEVARGERPTVFTDQWSLAAVGTGLVLGHAIWPWHDDNSIGTPGGQITSGDCSTLIDTLAQQWPALARVLGRALSPAALDRYPSMHEFVAALKALAEVAGASERVALGALLWSRQEPPVERPTATAPERVEPASFHQAPTVQVDTPPLAAERAPPDTESAITRIAPVLVAVAVVSIVVALALTLLV